MHNTNAPVGDLERDTWAKGLLTRWRLSENVMRLSGGTAWKSLGCPFCNEFHFGVFSHPSALPFATFRTRPTARSTTCSLVSGFPTHVADAALASSVIPISPPSQLAQIIHDGSMQLRVFVRKVINC